MRRHPTSAFYSEALAELRERYRQEFDEIYEKVKKEGKSPKTSSKLNNYQDQW